MKPVNLFVSFPLNELTCKQAEVAHGYVLDGTGEDYVWGVRNWDISSMEHSR